MVDEWVSNGESVPWYWQRKRQVPGDKSIPVPHFSLWMVWDRTRACWATRHTAVLSVACMWWLGVSRASWSMVTLADVSAAVFSSSIITAPSVQNASKSARCIAIWPSSIVLSFDFIGLFKDFTGHRGCPVVKVLLNIENIARFTQIPTYIVKIKAWDLLKHVLV